MADLEWAFFTSKMVHISYSGHVWIASCMLSPSKAEPEETKLSEQYQYLPKVIHMKEAPTWYDKVC